MIPRVNFTRNGCPDASICAEFADAGILIAAHRGDKKLEEKAGEKTADLFARAMEISEDVTDVYTEISGETVKIVVCLRDDERVDTVKIGKALQRILQRIFGGVGLSPAPFWLAPATTHPSS